MASLLEETSIYLGNNKIGNSTWKRGLMLFDFKYGLESGAKQDGMEKKNKWLRSGIGEHMGQINIKLEK